MTSLYICNLKDQRDVNHVIIVHKYIFFTSLSHKDRHINFLKKKIGILIAILVLSLFENHSSVKSSLDIKRICPDIVLPYFTYGSQLVH